MLGASVVTGSLLANFLQHGREARSSSSYATHAQNDQSVANVSRAAGLTAMYTVPGNENITDSSKSFVNAQPQKQQSWGSALGIIQDEFVDVMKGAVLGTVMGTVRKMIQQNMPSISEQFEKMVNNVSKKLGTEPLKPYTNRDQAIGNGQATENVQSPSGSYNSFGSMQGGEPYGRAQ